MAEYRHQWAPRSSEFGESKISVRSIFFIGPDPKNEALDLNIEVSGPKNKNISNQKDKDGRISTPTALQKFRIWGIKDLGEIYLSLLAPTPNMRVWTQELRSLKPRSKTCLITWRKCPYFDTIEVPEAQNLGNRRSR